MADEAVEKGPRQTEAQCRTASRRVLRVLVPRRQQMDHVPQLQEGAGLYQPDPMNNFPSPRPYRNKMTPSPIRLPNGWAGEGSPGPTAIRSTPRLRMAVFRRCRPTPRSRPVAANGSLPAPNEERGALPLRPAERGAYRAISGLPTGGTYRLRPADSGDPTRRSSDPRPGTLPLRPAERGTYRADLSGEERRDLPPLGRPRSPRGRGDREPKNMAARISEFHPSVARVVRVVRPHNRLALSIRLCGGAPLRPRATNRWSLGSA